MLTKNINFKNFLIKSNALSVKKKFKLLLRENLELINSLKVSYKYSYTKKLVLKLKKFSNIRVIGMGGSVLGAETIYEFLKDKISKKFFFINNLKINSNNFSNKNKILNLIISKSGNTLETISNVNILIKKKR